MSGPFDSLTITGAVSRHMVEVPRVPRATPKLAPAKPVAHFGICAVRRVALLLATWVAKQQEVQVGDIDGDQFVRSLPLEPAAPRGCGATWATQTVGIWSKHIDSVTEAVPDNHIRFARFRRSIQLPICCNGSPSNGECKRGRAFIQRDCNGDQFCGTLFIVRAIDRFECFRARVKCVRVFYGVVGLDSDTLARCLLGFSS